ncbi:hypothetical protein OG589_17770 [Sphaerisporangium sp. NBC_01403]|uniref:hypothetical protein n=1 Tax=Sphaerisporangium sp. NBC_01403 TaxID=2903599 RepID=UPI00324D6D2B
MEFDRAAVDNVLAEAGALGLISEVERAEIQSVLTPEFPYADALRFTDSVHAHVKVEDVEALPHAQLKELGYRAENAEPGYIKYATDAAWANNLCCPIPRNCQWRRRSWTPPGSRWRDGSWKNCNQVASWRRPVTAPPEQIRFDLALTAR